MTIKTYWWDGPGRIELLEKLAGDGLSASWIARELQDVFGERVTKNAVIGKCRREGIALLWRRPALAEPKEKEPMVVEFNMLLELHSTQKKSAMLDQLRTSLSSPSPLLAAITEDSLHDSAPPAGKPLMQLEPRDCRFPVAEDGEGRHLFCGEAKVLGAYCAHHARISYRTPDGCVPKKVRVFDPRTGRYQLKYQKGEAA